MAYKHPTKWYRGPTPVQHGLTEKGALSVANYLIRQKAREGFRAKLSGGKLRFTKGRSR
jgi:hypothetical protein